MPDFFVKDVDGAIYVVETKGREELELPQKMTRLKQWCADATAASQVAGGPPYRFVYVDQTGWQRNPPNTFRGLRTAFRNYQD